MGRREEGGREVIRESGLFGRGNLGGVIGEEGVFFLGSGGVERGGGNLEGEERGNLGEG